MGTCLCFCAQRSTTPKGKFVRTHLVLFLLKLNILAEKAHSPRIISTVSSYGLSSQALIAQGYFHEDAEQYDSRTLKASTRPCSTRPTLWLGADTYGLGHPCGTGLSFTISTVRLPIRGRAHVSIKVFVCGSEREPRPHKTDCCLWRGAHKTFEYLQRIVR